MKQDEAGNPIVKALTDTEYFTRLVHFNEVLELEASANVAKIEEEDRLFVEAVKAVRNELANKTEIPHSSAQTTLKQIMHSMKVSSLLNVSTVQSVVLGLKIYGDQSWTITAIRETIETNKMIAPLVNAELGGYVSNDHALLRDLLKTLLVANVELHRNDYTVLQIHVIESITSAMLNALLHGDDCIENLRDELRPWRDTVGYVAATAIKERIERVVHVLAKAL